MKNMVKNGVPTNSWEFKSVGKRVIPPDYLRDATVNDTGFSDPPRSRNRRNDRLNSGADITFRRHIKAK